MSGGLPEPEWLEKCETDEEFVKAFIRKYGKLETGLEKLFKEYEYEKCEHPMPAGVGDLIVGHVPGVKRLVIAKIDADYLPKVMTKHGLRVFTIQVKQRYAKSV